jgi:hydroxymethylglutaryl-CoA reductase
MADLSGFYKLSQKERLALIKKSAGLSDDECTLLEKTGALDMQTADRMIENVIGTQEIPMGIATNFIINGEEVLIPMVLEEPSVVAAASHAAKLCKPEGFSTEGGEPLMTGQIQLVKIKNPEEAIHSILKIKEELLKTANEKDRGLVERGGGTIDLEAHALETIRGKMVIVNLTVNVMDAMGANAVNTMAEAIAPRIEEVTGGKSRLKIITNLAMKRLARARAVWKKETIGEDAIEGILDAYAFALADKFRCATHNKGIMNGIDAVALATAQDFRALEAAAHCYAAIDGKYRPLTKYFKDERGDLLGEIELPVAVGTVGGASRTNPVAKVALKILGVHTAKEFSQLMAAVGLAQNFAALKALSTEGIQTGHMKLHSKNIAVLAGAREKEIDIVSEQMTLEKNITVARAQEILETIRKR